MHESEKWKWKWSRSVVSNSKRPHGLQPTRLLCPWDFPGKSTGVGCHCLLQEISSLPIYVCTHYTWAISTCKQFYQNWIYKDFYLVNSATFKDTVQDDFQVHVQWDIVSIRLTCMLSVFDCVWLFVTLWTIHSLPGTSTMGFSRHEYWSGLPYLPLGDLPMPRIEHMSLTSPALAGMFLTIGTTWEAQMNQ